MKTFNRILCDNPASHSDLSSQNPLNYQKRIHNKNRMFGAAMKRGFSGFHEPQMMAQNKTKQINPTFATPLHISKPILSGLRRKEDNTSKHQFSNAKNSFRQTAIGFSNSKPKERSVERFYETAVSGFGFHNRPTSKRQPRGNRSSQFELQNIRNEEISLEDTEMEDVDSNSERVNEEEQMLIVDFRELEISPQKPPKDERPLTSKGFKRKIMLSSEMEMSGDETLFDETSGLNKKEISLTDINVEMRERKSNKRQQSRRDGHPSSAHHKNRPRASDKIDPLVKINPSSPRKSLDANAPFESLIGSEFLSLFANGRP